MSTERFIRQEFLNDISPDAQKILRDSGALILGAGGLGSPVLLYLAGAGVGRITIADRDVITESNLNRQILYTPAMIGLPKAQAAADYLKSFYPDGRITPYIGDITAEWLDELIPRHRLVFDCCDNHATRMLIAESCHKHHAPCVVTGISRLEGFTFISIPGKTVCYGCLYGTPPPKTACIPQVLGATAGVFGSLAAASGILVLLGHNGQEQMVLADLKRMAFDTVETARSKDCPVCAQDKGTAGCVKTPQTSF